MELLIDFAESFICYVSVDLSRTYIAVAQHHLHRAQISPILQQMSCKTVPKQVRCNMPNSSLLSVVYNQLPERLATDGFALCTDEQRRVAAPTQ